MRAVTNFWAYLEVKAKVDTGSFREI